MTTDDQPVFDFGEHDAGNKAGAAEAAKPEAKRRSNRQNYNLGILKLHQIEPSPNDPRKVVDDADIESAMVAIRSQGKVVEPIVVTAANHQRRYTIISGILGFHAAKRLGLEDVPVHIVECKDEEVLRLLLDMAHKPLHPVDFAETVVDVAGKIRGGQDTLVQIIGKHKTAISRASRIAALSQEVKTAMREPTISFSVAYELADPALTDDIRLKLLEHPESLSTKFVRARIDRLTRKPPTKGARTVAELLLKMMNKAATWLKTNGESGDPLNLTLNDVIARLEAFLGKGASGRKR